jgi:DNA modification methylase
MSLPLNQIVQGDCLEVMKDFPDESLDCLVTDPPYGLEFMGKDWDRAVVSAEVWRECLRVLKSGAFAFIMCTPRLDCLSQMAVNLKTAGFEIGFTPIYWAYASGFPKSENIGKIVDKRRGCDVSKYINESQRTNTEIADYCGVTSTLVGYWRKNTRQISLNEWVKLKEFLHITDPIIDQRLTPATREVIGTQIKARAENQNFALPTQGAETKYIEIEQTVSATPEAKVLDGCYGGFQPKPSVEIVIIAMKPLSEKTFVDQALANRKGVTWLDSGRIPITSKDDLGAYEFHRRGFHERADLNCRPYEGGWKPRTVVLGEPKGRFPANLLCSDDVLNDGVKTRSSGHVRHNQQIDVYHGGYKYLEAAGIEDEGSFSRFFDLDKWFSEKLKLLPESVRRTFPFLIEKPKAYKTENSNEEACQNKITDANNAANRFLTTKATEKELNINSAHENVMLYTDLQNRNPNASSVEKNADYTEIDFAQELAQIKQGMETLLADLSNDLTINTTLKKPSLFSQSAVNYAERKINYWKDIIQTLINQPKLFGYVSHVIIKQMQQDLSLDQVWQNFWQERIKLLDEGQQRTFPFAIIAKASKSERNQGCEDLEPKKKHTNSGDDHVINEICPKHHITLCSCGWRSPPAKNFHPTVKPLKLMSYLVTLGSRKDDVVLDPFVGSGTTCLAARNLCRNSIGIEIEPEYCEIARKRLATIPERLDTLLEKKVEA